jgi:hypothetical protein
LSGTTTSRKLLTTMTDFFTQTQQTKKLRGFSPQANYTGRATAHCRRSKCQI